MVHEEKKESPPKSEGSDGNCERNNLATDFNGVTLNSTECTRILWRGSLRNISLAALWLPLGALIFCYVTASIFQPDDIHETHCRVYNVVPSISSITGISPQRYVWRMCIAFHLGPRLLIGSLYYNFHRERNLLIIDAEEKFLANKLVDACYWLNLVELFSLCGLTYVSNRENYFVHEKIFILFMVVSLLHMLCRAKVGCVASDKVEPVRTNGLTWTLFYVAITATAGLVIFFLRHRLLCRPLAFTWFSVCEYVLATTNMAFHAIVVRDLPAHEIQVVQPTRVKSS